MRTRAIPAAIALRCIQAYSGHGSCEEAVERQKYINSAASAQCGELAIGTFESATRPGWVFTKRFQNLAADVIEVLVEKYELKTG